ncbi:hypothetical protein PFISCL1PPCAC_17819, partial [Pristionchus fissidentatus]
SGGSSGAGLAGLAGGSRLSGSAVGSGRSHGPGVAGRSGQTGRAADAGGVAGRAGERGVGDGAVVSGRAGGSGVSGRTSLSRGSGRARRALRLHRLALLPGRESGEVLSLLTEDGVEGVLSRLGWRSHEDLDVHHLRPRGIGLGTEDLHAIDDVIVDVDDLLVETGNDDEAGDHRHGGGRRGHADYQLLLEHDKELLE